MECNLNSLCVSAACCVLLVISVPTVFAGGSSPAAPAPVPPAVYQRTVFLGDSITDGYTYPQLVRDSLAAAKLPRMVAIDAGIGGDTMKGMRARVDRDVLAFHPTMVTISAGANDVGSGATPEAYAADMRAVVDELTKQKITVILLTPNVVGAANQAKMDPTLGAYEAQIRAIASAYGLRVAEVNKNQNADLAAGHVETAHDGYHPNYEGQRMIARAVLDAMGYADIPVLQRTNTMLDPGVIPQWRIRVVGAGEPPLTEATAATVMPDATWGTIDVPQPTSGVSADDLDALWKDDMRKEGVVVNLDKLYAPGGKYIVAATYRSRRDQTLQLHTGAELTDVWLNGKLVYASGGLRGWHPGRETVAVDVHKGDNFLVAETGSDFYLSVTDGPMWR